MPKEIFEVVRERFHLSDRTQYIVQGHWPKDAVMEAYLDQHKLKVSVKENENVSALERFKDPEFGSVCPISGMIKSSSRNFRDRDTAILAAELIKMQINTMINCILWVPVIYFRSLLAVWMVF